MYSAESICTILHSDPSLLSNKKATVSKISMDTRKMESPKETLFFALSGSMHDGHDFIHEAVAKGVKNIVAEKVPGLLSGDINIYLVPNSLKALQALATYHRNRYPDLDVIGITGSNGKTTIKEWLYQMITDRQVVKSPKSYNSQTGVPLSIWQIKETDHLGIFEAGISEMGEMESLASIIQPQIGLFTLIGDAHAEGFESIKIKLVEKLKLFEHVSSIIYNNDDQMVDTMIQKHFPKKTLLSWGTGSNSSLFEISKIVKFNNSSEISIRYNDAIHQLTIPFTDSASIQNAMHCTATMLVLGMSLAYIQSGLHGLQNIPMRLEMKNGIQDSILINDTYNADIQSFKIALEFLSQQAGTKEKVLIISDFLQTGLDEENLNVQISKLIHSNHISHVIAVGIQVKSLEKYLDPFILFSHYLNTSALIKALAKLNFNKKAILVKGARSFELERVIKALQDKAHSATLETDLQAIEHNLKIFSQHVSPKTQIIAVIKASAYGSGSEELARFLAFKKISYLAVAFIDEGIQLRKSNITLPIIILNPDRNGVVDMIKYNLEPEVYSLDQIKEIISVVSQDPSNIVHLHIKVDTGMHRLGFLEEDINELGDLLRSTNQVKVKTIFSHLSSSEDPGDDDYTHLQVKILNRLYDRLAENVGYRPMKHILNSSGIIRFPEYHFDMVRLGLGLYGIDSTNTLQNKLEKVHTLKATVIQIKMLDASAYIGYNKKGKLYQRGQIAIINIGYADGLIRQAGNGRYMVQIHGADYPIIGNVCMDLSIIDIGDAKNIKVADEVIIFGKSKPIEYLAEVCHTIPYEILSRISSRVRRLYIQG